MRRSRLIGLSGLALAGLLAAFSMGARPTLRAQQPAAAVAAPFVRGAFGGGEEPPKMNPSPIQPVTIAEMKTRLKLQEKIPLHFPNDTPLSEVVKYIRERTADKADLPDGLPIYVDPVGLQDADRTQASTVAIELKGIPLAASLKLALAQLSLTYWVTPDGLMIITNSDSEEIPTAPESQILEKLTQLQREVMILHGEVRILRGLATPGGAPTPGAGQVTGPGGMGGGFR